MKKILLLIFLFLSGCSFTPTLGQDLIGKNKNYLKKHFGEPTVFRTESPNQIWAYRIENCSLILYLNDKNIVQFVDYSGQCP